jgi:hypothetical protein
VKKPLVLRLAVVLPGLLLGTLLAAQANPGAPAAPGDAHVVTLYVNRVVVAGQGDIALGMLVHPSGSLSPEQQEAMSRSVTVLGEAVQYMPTSLYMPKLESAFGDDAIVVGSRTMLIPKGTSAEGEPYLLDRLGEFLAVQGVVDEGKVEISFTQSSLKGAAPQDGTPTFTLVKTSRGVEVSFLLTGSGGNTVSGRVTLPSGSMGADFQRGVKSSSPVRVVFRKGPITVEVPGKTLSNASVGENVSVVVSEGQKTFTGRVLDGKAVQVDLP